MRKEFLTIRSYIGFDFKKFLSKRYLISFIVVVLILQIFIQYGKYRFVDILKSSKIVQEAEWVKVDNYSLYRQYAAFGITIFFISSDFSVLYSNPLFEELLSSVNTAERLNIYKSLKGKEFFIAKTGYLNFIGILFLIGILFALFYGMDTTYKKKYLKFLSTISSSKRAFWSIVLARIIILNIVSLFLLVISITPLLLNEINLFRIGFIPIFMGASLVFSLFFGFGCIVGRLNVKDRFIRSIVMGSIYFFFVIIMPLLANIFIQISANDIERLFEFDLYNLKLIQAVEKRLIAKYGVLKPGEKPKKELIKAIEEELNKALENEFKEMRDREKERKNKVLRKISGYQTISAFIPTLFYFSICEEVSSHGGLSFVDFYSFSDENKKLFTEFCFKKLYSGDNLPDTGKVENFFKNDDDGLFFAKSRIPHSFLLGVFVSLFYIAVLFIISYRMFLKQNKGEPGKISDFDVDMKSDEFNYLLTADQGLKSQVYNCFTGKGTTYVKIEVDGKILEQKDIDFIYVYETTQFLKDIDQRLLYKERFGKEMPGDMKPWQFLIQYAADAKKILLLDNFFIGMSIDDIEKFIDDVKKNEILALYIGEDYFQAVNLDDHLIFCTDDMSIPGIAEKVKAFNNKK